MPERDFRTLERRLLDGGVTPVHARRIAEELAEHWRDLCYEAGLCGLTGDEALRYADEHVGDEPDITAAVLARRDLKCWTYRYPNLARIALPLAWFSLLPLVPIAAGVYHAPLIARWGACFMLSGFFTGGLMLVLYLTILAT
jgi:hypothetical protein